MNQSAPRMTDCLRLLVYFFVTNNYPKSVYNPHQSTLSTCGALNSSGRCAFVTFMRSKFTGLFFFFFFHFRIRRRCRRPRPGCEPRVVVPVPCPVLLKRRPSPGRRLVFARRGTPQRLPDTINKKVSVGRDVRNL